MRILSVAFLAAVTTLAGALPAAGEVNYTAEDAAALHRSAMQLGISVDDMHVAAASVHHFLLGIGGKLEQPKAGCSLELGGTITTSEGQYRYSTDFRDATALQTVAAYYCVSMPEAHRIDAALFVFLVNLLALEDVATVVPPPMLGEPKLVRTGINIVQDNLGAGRYSSFATGVCKVRRLAKVDPRVVASEFDARAGDQLIVDIAPSDAAIEVSPGCGTWYLRVPTTPPAQPHVVLPAGTAIVGVDVAPGRYRTVTTGICGVARLTGFGGSFAEIAASDVYPAGASVSFRITGDDVGVLSDSACGPWERVA